MAFHLFQNVIRQRNADLIFAHVPWNARSMTSGICNSNNRRKGLRIKSRQPGYQQPLFYCNRGDWAAELMTNYKNILTDFGLCVDANPVNNILMVAIVV